MSSIALSGNASGAGVFTIASPNSASSFTATLPAATTTLVGTDATQTLTNKTLGAGTVLPAGAVLQVIQTTTDSQLTITGTTYTDVTGLSVSITPSSASNKILILATVNHGVDGIRATALKLLRDSTDINIGTGSMGSRTPASTVGIGENFDANRGEVSSINFLDSPNTTSAITYKIQVGILESTSLLGMYILFSNLHKSRYF